MSNYKPAAREQQHTCLQEYKNGALIPNITNALALTRGAKSVRDCIAYNGFTGQVTMVARPPFDLPEQMSSLPRPWSDADDTRLTAWLQERGLQVRTNITREAVEIIAQDNWYHPVRDYLEGLSWDNLPRLDTWLSTYLGAREDNYTRAIGVKWMISAVARIFEPGAKVDTALVLEGNQGLGKSSALRILAGDWFIDGLSDVKCKDAVMQLQGAWIVELAELAALSRNDTELIKAFITRNTDKYRPPYGKRVVEQPRQCVFAGTVNKSDYLKDETGARRFWPARCLRINLNALARDRDHLWAEAVFRYGKEEVWWIDDERIRALARDEQKARYRDDPWAEKVEDYLTGRNQARVCEILENVLSLPVDRMDQRAQNRVVHILRHLGFERKSKRINGRPVKVYVRITEECD